MTTPKRAWLDEAHYNFVTMYDCMECPNCSEIDNTGHYKCSELNVSLDNFSEGIHPECPLDDYRI